jgi:hypothetical protein
MHGSTRPDWIDLAEEVKDRFSCQVCRNKNVAEQTDANLSEGDEPITDIETAWKICNGSFYEKKTTIKDRLSRIV